MTHSPRRMFSTLFKSPSGKVVMIDGGWPIDADFLVPALKELGGTVDAWFLTHAHCDHYGALADILTKPKLEGLKIKKVVHHFLPVAFIAETEKGSLPYVTPFLKNLRMSRLKVETPKIGQVWDFGEGLTFECLNDYDLAMRGNSINCSSICRTGIWESKIGASPPMTRICTSPIATKSRTVPFLLSSMARTHSRAI